jgi:hypothetical protein
VLELLIIWHFFVVFVLFVFKEKLPEHLELPVLVAPLLLQGLRG